MFLKECNDNNGVTGVNGGWVTKKGVWSVAVSEYSHRKSIFKFINTNNIRIKDALTLYKPKKVVSNSNGNEIDENK